MRGGRVEGRSEGGSSVTMTRGTAGITRARLFGVGVTHSRKKRELWERPTRGRGGSGCPGTEAGAGAGVGAGVEAAVTGMAYTAGRLSDEYCSTT